jgi:hypothetical protein
VRLASVRPAVLPLDTVKRGALSCAISPSTKPPPARKSLRSDGDAVERLSLPASCRRRIKSPGSAVSRLEEGAAAVSMDMRRDRSSLGEAVARVRGATIAGYFPSSLKSRPRDLFADSLSYEVTAEERFSDSSGV